MTTTFFLVRHAAHDDVGRFLAGRMPNIFLGPAGRAQALRLGRRMSQERFSAIFSSPRERTQETAKAISETCAVGPVSLRDELDEIDFGEWSGETLVELNQNPSWRQWNDQRATARTPGGESMEDVRMRVCACMEDLADKYRDGAVVLVSHADVIKSAVCHVLGLPVDACFRFDVEPASISVVVAGNWGSKLTRLNDGVS